MTTPIIQWLVFRGVGHAQTAVNEVVPHLPVVACGRTSWPGLVKYQPRQPERICEECGAALGMASPPPSPGSPPLPPPTPKQGSLF